MCVLMCLFEDPSAALYSHCLPPPLSEMLPTFQVVLSLTFHFILPFGGEGSFCAYLNISALWHCAIEIKHSTPRITFPIDCLLG